MNQMSARSFLVADGSKTTTGKHFTKELVRYDFDHPIRLVAFRTGGLDTLFYAVMLSTCVTVILLILSLRDGKLHLEFTLGRTLLSFPFAVLAVIFFQLLRELRVYPPKLLKQNVWTIEELTVLTGKSRKDTEQIITRVLEACFTVSAECILNGSDAETAPLQAGSDKPSEEEPVHEDGFSKYDD